VKHLYAARFCGSAMMYGACGKEGTAVHEQRQLLLRWHVLTAVALLLLLPQVKSDAAGPQFDQAAMDAVKQAGMEVSIGTAAATAVAEDTT
jgi:hypothetical protein